MSSGKQQKLIELSTTLFVYLDKLHEEHLKNVVDKLGVSDCKHLYDELDGLTNEEVTRLEKGTNTGVDIEEEAKAVFLAWIKKEGAKATRQAVLTALGNCENNLAKQKLEELWGKGN